MNMQHMNAKDSNVNATTTTHDTTSTTVSTSGHHDASEWISVPFKECDASLDEWKMMNSKVDLVLPSTTRDTKSSKQKVVLMCSSVASWHDRAYTSEIIIQEKRVSKLEVSKVLFETAIKHGKRVIIFQCKMEGLSSNLCLKLMDDDDIFQKEMQAYERMIEKSEAPEPQTKETRDDIHVKDGVERLFLPVYFFCEVIMPDNRAWKGYCMQEGKYSLRDILCPAAGVDTIHGALEQKKLLKNILQDKENSIRSLINTPPEPSAALDQHGTSMMTSGQEEGEPVIFQEKQSVQMSIAIAALRLLNRMHVVHGWAHGDSHLGNFMYMEGKIYAIDFERSFKTIAPVQHLLDIQEFFGHFSGVLLNLVRNNEWDMHDIFGMYYYRHPLMSRGGFRPQSPKSIKDQWMGKASNYSRRKTLYMLPICMCFTCPTKELRVKGCDFCRSTPNLMSALYMCDHFDEMIQDMSDWGLCKMKGGLKFTRTDTIMRQVCGVVDLVYPCIQSGSILSSSDTVLVVENSRLKKRKRVEIDETTSLLDAKMVYELTRSKQSCVVVMKRLLYMAFVNKKAHEIVKEIVKKLHNAGFTRAGDLLWANVAPSPDDERI